MGKKNKKNKKNINNSSNNNNHNGSCDMTQLMRTKVVDRLVDIFPQYTRKQIEHRVSSFPVDGNEDKLEGTIDRLIDLIVSGKCITEPELKATEINTSPNLTPDEQILVEMFPLYKPWILQLALCQHNGILIDCVDDLTNNEDKWLQVQKEAEQATPTADTNNPWKSPKIGRFCYFTNLSKAEAQSYLHKNNNSLLRALVDFILNHENVKQTVSIDIPALIPSGGRVQRGNQGTIMKSSTAVMNSNCTTAIQKYVYDKESPEAQELDLIYLGTPQFRNKISHNFVKRSLEFCEGATDKVLEMMLEVATVDVEETTQSKLSPILGEITFSSESQDITKLESNNEWHSYSSRVSTTNNTLSVAEANDRAFLLRRKLQSVNTNNLRKSGVTGYYTERVLEAQSQVRAAINEDQNMKVNRIVDKAQNTNTLDLHGLDVTHAIHTTQAALSEWWNGELEARDLKGIHHVKGKARHAQPYIVITGRGLHLKGGVLVLKRAIQRFLDSNSYQYQEGLLLFSVIGKS